MGHGHGRRRAHDAPFEVQLPITPMLDMSFQLLAFFLLTFKTASAMEGQMDMYLPAAGQAKAAAPADVDPFANAEKDQEVPAEVTVSVEAANGAVGKLTIREKEGVTTVESTKALREKLEKVRSGLPVASQNSIKIESEGELRYAFLIEVMDACRKAGFSQVGFAPPTDLGRK